MAEVETLLNKKTQAHANQKGFPLTYLGLNALYHNLFIIFLFEFYCVYSKMGS